MSDNQMCWLCEASSVNLDMLWTGLGPDAGWRRTRWSHEAYFAYLTAPVIVAPLLLAIVTGFRLEGLFLDGAGCRELPCWSRSVMMLYG